MFGLSVQSLLHSQNKSVAASHGCATPSQYMSYQEGLYSEEEAKGRKEYSDRNAKSDRLSCWTLCYFTVYSPAGNAGIAASQA
jgi:hypothetical protein